MTMTPQQRQAIDRAKHRVAETAIQFERVYFDETFTLAFLPTLSQPALEIVSNVQRMAQADSTATLADKLQAALDFMDAMAVESTAELIAELARAGVMTINDLVDLLTSVVEAVSGRPTMRSSSSPTGSVTPGQTSTASAQPATSTQQPYHSIGY